MDLFLALSSITSECSLLLDETYFWCSNGVLHSEMECAVDPQPDVVQPPTELLTNDNRDKHAPINTLMYSAQ